MIYRLLLGGAMAEVDTLGGELIAYRSADGASCLWGGDTSVWSGHSPHLFPIIGTLRDGCHHIQEEAYPLPKHGLLRNTEFTVTEISECSITLLREETEQSLAQYPFLFSFYVTHKLTDGGFETNYKIVNRSLGSMPFCLGGHPAFACPVFANEAFEDYELVLDGFGGNTALLAKDDSPLDCSTVVALPMADSVLPLSHRLSVDSVLIFENTGCNKITLQSKNNNYAVQLNFSGFPNFALWTFGSKKAQYICIEPWHGLPALTTDTAVLVDKPYCIQLESGEVKELAYQVVIAPHKALGGD